MGYKIFNCYKPLGKTPLQVVDALRAKSPGLKNKPMTYLGRLDPMAEGVLLIMAGKHTQADREKYLKLDKTYKATILFGFSTDSFDLLGMASGFKKADITKHSLQKVLQNYPGKISLLAPKYSSIPINGKPSFEWARKNKTIKPLLRESVIYDIKLNKIKSISRKNLENYIKKNIKKVSGDFRQEKILQRWNKVLFSSNQNSFLTADISVSCSSGTYVRSLANDIGRKLKTKACLFKLVRSRVGDYDIKESIRIR